MNQVMHALHDGPFLLLSAPQVEVNHVMVRHQQMPVHIYSRASPAKIVVRASADCC